MGDLSDRLAAVVRDETPEPYISFWNVMALHGHPVLFQEVIEALATPWRGVDAVAAPEARAFVPGTAVALFLGVPLICLRRPDKLAGPTIRGTFANKTFHCRSDAICEGSTVLVVDDTLATGITARACQEVVRQAGGKPVGVSVILDLATYGGRALVEGVVVSLMTR